MAAGNVSAVNWMTGPVIVGGSTYRLAELDDLPFVALHRPEVLPGVPLIAGSMWTIAAPAGRGATTLAVRLAVAAARVGRVKFANNHLATRALRDRVVDEVRRVGLTEEETARVELASWLPLPDLDARVDDPWEGGDDCRLLVLDTADEMLVHWPETPELRLRTFRRLRDMARYSNTAVILTARVEAPASPGREAYLDSWRAHWARPVFDDISDVSVQMWRSERGGWDDAIAVTQRA